MKNLMNNLEGVIGDFLDTGDTDLPYNVIEDLAEHVAGWIIANKKEIIEEIQKCIEQ